MNDKDRIRLAEAMGIVANSWGHLPFNPDTDANDCEALIRHLQEKGYDIEIWWSGTAFTHRSNVCCRVKIKFRSDMYWHPNEEGLARDDWKQCVCELALKVLDND